MNPLNRRRFLHASALGAAGLGAAPAPAAAADDKRKPRFRLGLVTYNLAAAWKLPFRWEPVWPSTAVDLYLSNTTMTHEIPESEHQLVPAPAVPPAKPAGYVEAPAPETRRKIDDTCRAPMPRRFSAEMPIAIADVLAPIGSIAIM